MNAIKSKEPANNSLLVYPDGLPPEFEPLWDRIIRDLTKDLRAGDVFLLEHLIRAEARACDLEADIRENGYVLETTGKPNPAVAMLTSVEKVISVFATKLGLGAPARSHIQRGASEPYLDPADDPWAKFGV